MIADVQKAQDQAYDIGRYSRSHLDAFFAPSSVAVIGATDRVGSVGRSVLWNLMHGGFEGRIIPVNPRRSSVLGLPSFPTIGSILTPIDLAIIVTPASTVPDMIAECVAAGVQAAVVISAGFKERGPAGVALEQEILQRAKRPDGTSLRIIGPNCLGIMRPSTGLNATFARTIAQPGSVGFISQSGALCTAILDWSAQENVGFSAFVSVGSMLDVGWGDLIQYLGDDPKTESIVIYMESIGNARHFLSAAREVARTKPIIVIKAGRTASAAKAAASHTGALTGDDAVLDAAFRRCGVLRVDSIAELFDMANVLSKQPRPKGPRLTILTNAGGPGVLATDALIGCGGELALLSDSTHDALDGGLPQHWSHANPIDILGDADADRFAHAILQAAKDPNSDGLLTIFCPQSTASPSEVAAQVAPFAHLHGKPMLASWMGGLEAGTGEAILNQAGIPTYAYPDEAARVFCAMWRYSDALRSLYETPVLPLDHQSDDAHRSIESMLDGIRLSGRTLLTEVEAKTVLAAYGLPVVPTRTAYSVDEAVSAAETIGYPVVLKLLSETITHKTDVGGVVLNLADAAAVRTAYHAIHTSVTNKAGSEHFLGVSVQSMIDAHGHELIIGSSVDAQFGPVILFGSGGKLVEVYQDRALALPPLNTTLARRMMEQTKIYTALSGVRGSRSIDLMALEQMVVRFSQLVVEHPQIKEIEINPLLATEDGLLALDARVVLHDATLADDALPRPAIRPYPSQYVSTGQLSDGSPVVFRPIRAEDEPRMVTFHHQLSESSVYLRYFQFLKLDDRVAHDRLTKICFIDYDREMALVVERQHPETGVHEILGVGRLSKISGTQGAEFALLVADAYQGHGLGMTLLQRLVEIARQENLHYVSGEMLADNTQMQTICRKLGFYITHRASDGVVHARIELPA